MAFFSKFFNFFKPKKTKIINTEQIETLYSAAIIYYKKRDYLNSRKYFQKALILDPQNIKIIKNLQVTNKKLQQQMKQDAIEKAKKANKTNIEQKNNNSTSIGLEPFETNFIPEADRDSNFYYKMLRIDTDASNEEINIRLNAEFRKWRTKVNSPSIKKRYEAEEMLAIISQAKRKLLK